MRLVRAAYIVLITTLLVAVMLKGSCQPPAVVLTGLVSNQYGRIGIRIVRSGPRRGRINKVHGQSPAADAGLKEGDRVVAVDGVRPTDIDMIDGQAGQFVRLTVRRKADPEHEVDLTIVRTSPRFIK